MNEHWTDRLSEYLDDDLAPPERAAVEAHLARCAECSNLLADLAAVVQHARALENEPPVVDLWPALRARLAPRRHGIGARLASWLGAGAPRFSFTFPQIVAAAATLVVLTGGAMWLALNGHPVGRLVSAVDGTEAVPITFEEARYSAAVEELERTLRTHRAELDTSTVRVLEQNLAIIDRAVEDARGALKTDPSSSYLNGHLASQLRRKYRLLQRATEVIAAHS